eukprot:5478663-Amphidinium_carterae.1
MNPCPELMHRSQDAQLVLIHPMNSYGKDFPPLEGTSNFESPQIGTKNCTTATAAKFQEPTTKNEIK